MTTKTKPLLKTSFLLSVTATNIRYSFTTANKPIQTLESNLSIKTNDYKVFEISDNSKALKLDLKTVINSNTDKKAI